MFGWLLTDVQAKRVKTIAGSIALKAKRTSSEAEGAGPSVGNAKRKTSTADARALVSALFKK
eukprot:14075609-Alexandrium_andersonii.AAC.2